jgi:UTP--glucose-1-phosphate uridylyltransferase
LDVDNLIEKPGKAAAPSDYATVSGFVFTPDIFDYLTQVLAELQPGQEFYYIDALRLMLKDGKRVLAKEIEGGVFHDTGNKLEYLKTVVEFALKNPEVSEDFRNYLAKLKLE